LSGCVIQPPEKIIPYIKQRKRSSGRGLWFASAFHARRASPRPFFVRSNEGRPTKIEGNPDHPSTGGGTATDIFRKPQSSRFTIPIVRKRASFRSETRTGWRSSQKFAD
jgi:molybdopterin-containing oxidoreductase family iron-sulfur binding subunit